MKTCEQCEFEHLSVDCKPCVNCHINPADGSYSKFTPKPQEIELTGHDTNVETPLGEQMGGE